MSPERQKKSVSKSNSPRQDHPSHQDNSPVVTDLSPLALRTDSCSSAGAEGSMDSGDCLLLRGLSDRWLHVKWSIGDKTLERADSVMGRHAHGIQKILRIHAVGLSEIAPPSSRHYADVAVEEDVTEWFLILPRDSVSWMVELGYRFGKDRFFSLLRSTAVTLPERQSSMSPDAPLLSESLFRELLTPGDPLSIDVCSILTVAGKTLPGAKLDINEQHVEVDAQSGAFSWQTLLPNGRVVYPIFVEAGHQIRRALLAVEVNFRLLDPEPEEEEL